MYDDLRRLKTVTLRTAGGSLLGSESVNYGASGNIDSKGIYTNYQYSLPGRPQQVSAVTTPGGTCGYSYEANGNLTQVTGPGARTVTWWSFNKPRRMQKDGSNHAEYWYGPGGDRAMFRQSARINGQTVLTLYGSALYERRHAGGAATQHTHHIHVMTQRFLHRSGC